MVVLAMTLLAGWTPARAAAWHIVTAINGRPIAVRKVTVRAGDKIELAVSSSFPTLVGSRPRAVQYFLNPNLELVGSRSGAQATGLCRPITAGASQLPNGVQGNARPLSCSWPDPRSPLVLTAKVTGTAVPLDDPYAAVACLPGARTCQPVRIAVRASTSRLSSVGPQRTALILASAPGMAVHPYADKQATASVFYSASNPGSARSFFSQASYGLSTITGANATTDGTATDVYGPYVTATATCGFDLALADPDIDYARYDRLVVLMNNPACGNGGLSVTQPVQYTTGDGTLLLTVSNLYNSAFGEPRANGRIGPSALHEYGHMLGMQHAGAWYCGASAVAANGCYGNGYFEPVDVVSQGGMYAHPNSVHKERLGWLEGGRILPVWHSGTYTINAYEDAGVNVKVLKIPRKLLAAGSPSVAGGSYYLSYRRPTPPWDLGSWATTFAGGITIHMDEAAPLFDTALLDATPRSLAGLGDIDDAPLLPQQTFTDPLAGVSMTVLNVSPAAAQVAVTITTRTTRFVQLAIEAQTIVNVTASDVGTVTGGGSYAPGQSAALTASANPGWQFSGWWDYGGAQRLVSSSNPYALAVDGDSVLWAHFTAASPPNDAFASATRVNAMPSQLTLFSGGATSEPGEPFPVNVCNASGTPGGHTVWYTISVPIAQRIVIDANGDGAADIAVYTGPGVSNLALVPGACDVWTYEHWNPRVTLDAVPNTLYHVQLDTAGGNNVLSFSIGP
jgi:hypothetical protein